MIRTIRIRRQASPSGAPYLETYRVAIQNDNSTVASVLLDLRESDRTDVSDMEGVPIAAAFREVVFSHSCLQKRCGACAMVINDRPALACDTYIRNVKGEPIMIAPLKKFPVIRDLLTDRTPVTEKLKEADKALRPFPYNAAYRIGRKIMVRGK